MPFKSAAYAIDFGTSNSLLCVVADGKVSDPVDLDPTSKNSKILRSILYSANSKDFLFGEEAKQAYVENSMEGRLLRSFKRFLPNRTFTGSIFGNRLIRLEDLVGMFLKEVRTRANRQLGMDVDSVVMGRPALFSDDPEADRLAQSRLEKGARLAGFNHIEFLAEPIAAAYRYRKEMTREERVLVADFGGGTSDFTVLNLSPREFRPEDVLAIGGLSYAGDALDGNVMRHRVARNFGSEVTYQFPMTNNVLTMPKALMAHLCSTAQIQLLSARDNAEFLRLVSNWSLGPADQHAMERLKTLLDNQLGFSVFEAIESGKVQLSTGEHALIQFDYPDCDIREEVSRDEFREYTGDVVEKIFRSLDATLEQAGLKASEIDRVCCTGGTARAFVIQEQLLQRFGAEKLESYRHFSSIVEGLGLRGLQLMS